MELLTQKREENISSKEVRKRGRIPAIVYGKKQDPISISIDSVYFEKIYSQVGMSAIFDLKF